LERQLSSKYIDPYFTTKKWIHNVHFNFSFLFVYYRGYESQSASVAAQPVGFAGALQAARERIAVLFHWRIMCERQKSIHYFKNLFLEFTNWWSNSSSAARSSR
jgi:hypothetical protein